MIPLTEEEKRHVEGFAASRPDWRTVVLARRLIDENENTRSHKYAKAHPYITGMKYVLDYLREQMPCRVLDIGSPIAQNVSAACLPGVSLTVLDVRQNDDAEALGLAWVNATATAIPYPDASWDLITCMWVMGHVGDGRYGDPFEVNGDRKLLAELARVLAPGGTLILGVGLIDKKCGNIFNLHRIYSWEWLREAFDAAGFDVEEERSFFVSDEIFLNDADFEAHRRDGEYGLARLRKR